MERDIRALVRARSIRADSEHATSSANAKDTCICALEQQLRFNATHKLVTTDKKGECRGFSLWENPTN